METLVPTMDSGDHPIPAAVASDHKNGAQLTEVALSSHHSSTNMSPGKTQEGSEVAEPESPTGVSTHPLPDDEEAQEVPLVRVLTSS